MSSGSTKKLGRGLFPPRMEQCVPGRGRPCRCLHAPHACVRLVHRLLLVLAPMHLQAAFLQLGSGAASCYAHLRQHPRKGRVLMSTQTPERGGEGPSMGPVAYTPPCHHGCGLERLVALCGPLLFLVCQATLPTDALHDCQCSPEPVDLRHVFSAGAREHSGSKSRPGSPRWESTLCSHLTGPRHGDGLVGLWILLFTVCVTTQQTHEPR